MIAMPSVALGQSRSWQARSSNPVPETARQPSISATAYPAVTPAHGPRRRSAKAASDSERACPASSLTLKLLVT